MGSPVIPHTTRYMSTNEAIAVALAAGPGALRWVAAYNPIMGSALGSIIAAIITAHAATNATASPTDGAMTIPVPAISSASIGDHSMDAQAPAVTSSKTAYVSVVARSRGATTALNPPSPCRRRP